MALNNRLILADNDPEALIFFIETELMEIKYDVKKIYERICEERMKEILSLDPGLIITKAYDEWEESPSIIKKFYGKLKKNIRIIGTVPKKHKNLTELLEKNQDTVVRMVGLPSPPSYLMHLVEEYLPLSEDGNKQSIGMGVSLDEAVIYDGRKICLKGNLCKDTINVYKTAFYTTIEKRLSPKIEIDLAGINEDTFDAEGVGWFWNLKSQKNMNVIFINYTHLIKKAKDYKSGIVFG